MHESNWEEYLQRPHVHNVVAFSEIAVGPHLVCFTFELRGRDGGILHTFHPCLKIPELWTALEHSRAQHPAVLQCLVALGMAYLSYVWMGFCTPSVEVRVRPRLDEAQLDFWRETFLKGLREHFLVNGIRDFAGEGTGLSLTIQQPDLPPEQDVPLCLPPRRKPAARKASATGAHAVLVPFGAGKDSSVAWEILGRAGCQRRWFFLEGEEGEFERCWRYHALAEVSGGADVLVAEFAWCTAEFERARNTRYELSGHLWACVVAFASAFMALLYDQAYVAVGNERSASVGNGVSWEGVEVNHQYDKGFAFEQVVHKYLQEHCGGLYYFSILQPLWDVQVGLVFARMCENYVPYVISCNMPKGRNKSRWCGECHKCAFVAAVFSAFMPAQRVWAVFGDSPLDSAGCIECLEEMVGVRQPALPALARAHAIVLGDAWTPFECVGGKRETILALRLALRRASHESSAAGRRLPRLFRGTGGSSKVYRAVSEAVDGDGSGSDFAMLTEWGEEHLIPEWALSAVRDCFHESLRGFHEEGILGL